MARKLPDEVKHVHGTDQPCRMNPDKPNYQALVKLPSAPKYLTKTARKIYRTSGKILLQYNILTVINLPQFVAYCREISIYIDIESGFDTIESRIQSSVNKHGQEYEYVSAKHRIAKEALNNARQLAMEFGLTPSAQSKIIAPFTKPQDTLDDFMNG